MDPLIIELVTVSALLHMGWDVRLKTAAIRFGPRRSGCCGRRGDRPGRGRRLVGVGFADTWPLDEPGADPAVDGIPCRLAAPRVRAGYHGVTANGGIMGIWGGRSSDENDQRIADFTRSIQVDAGLAADDLAASIAHVRGLGRAGIVTGEELDELVGGLTGPPMTWRPVGSTGIRRSWTSK